MWLSPAYFREPARRAPCRRAESRIGRLSSLDAAPPTAACPHCRPRTTTGARLENRRPPSCSTARMPSAPCDLAVQSARISSLMKPSGACRRRRRKLPLLSCVRRRPVADDDSLAQSSNWRAIGGFRMRAARGRPRCLDRCEVRFERHRASRRLVDQHQTRACT